MYPIAHKLVLPINPYQVGGYAFGERIRRHWLLTASHLGDDVTAPAGTLVVAAGDGEVVWAQIRRGTEERRNWGGLVIIGHSNDTGESFYTLYGHMSKLKVTVGEKVQQGQELGVVAGSYTSENGWWKLEHLHFSIYTGPWEGEILPGWHRPEAGLTGRGRRTRRAWWQDPRGFVAAYNGD